MKKLISIAIFILLPTLVMSQSAYYDAFYLSTQGQEVTTSTTIFQINLTDENKGRILEIFKNYVSDLEDLDELEGALRDNPFIRIATAHLDEKILSKGPSFSLSSIGGLNVTNIADGLAKFLVERAKEELSITFFRKFKEELDKQEELKTLFPNTYLWLQSIDTEIYNYSAYLGTLREAFQKDLSLIIQNLKKAMDLPKYEAFFKQHPKLKIVLQKALLIAQDIHDGKHPGDIIEHLADEGVNDLDSIDPNIKPGLQTLNLFSQSVRSRDDERYWVSTDSLKLLFKKDVVFKIYLGLIYQKADDISFTINGTSKPLKTILKELKEKYDALKSTYQVYLQDIVFKAEQSEIYLKTIREKNKNLEGGADYQDYYAFYTATLDLVESLSEFPDLKDVPWTKDKEKYFTIARRTGDLYVDVNEKNYSSVAFNLFLVFEEVFMKERREVLAQIRIEKEKKPADDTEVQRLEGLLTNAPDLSGQNLKILKYATFAAQVANAESSDQVKEAIAAVSLPAGSASIKRQTCFNISVNAYLGAHYGNEYLERDNAGHGRAGWGKIWGVSAPIGVAVSWGNFISRGGSASLFVSLIDVGGVASFRMKNDSTEQLPEIKLENIFAPGIHFVYGIPKTPISIGYGWQKGPQLRSVNIPDSANPGQYKNELLNGYRWSIFLAVDIPLFNLYTKPKK